MTGLSVRRHGRETGVVLFLLSAGWPCCHAADPGIVFTKTFPGSVPAYVEITVAKNGSTVYKEAPDDNNPITIQFRRRTATRCSHWRTSSTISRTPWNRV